MWTPDHHTLDVLDEPLILKPWALFLVFLGDQTPVF